MSAAPITSRSQTIEQLAKKIRSSIKVLEVTGADGPAGQAAVGELSEAIEAILHHIDEMAITADQAKKTAYKKAFIAHGVFELLKMALKYFWHLVQT